MIGRYLCSWAISLEFVILPTTSVSALTLINISLKLTVQK